MPVFLPQTIACGIVYTHFSRNPDEKYLFSLFDKHCIKSSQTQFSLNQVDVGGRVSYLFVLIFETA